MNRTRRSHFLAPAVVTVAGTAVAGAVALGHTWGDALITEVITLLIGLGYFFLTRNDSDVGAIYGHRADERQREVLSKSTRLAFLVMIVTAFVSVLITVALGDNYWQADLIGSVGGLSYLLGMVFYGAHDTDAATFQSDVMASISPDPERDLGDSSN